MRGVLIFLLLYNNFWEYGEACPTVCQCVKDTVDCSSRDLIDIPQGIPNNTRVLNLSENDIDTIESSNFDFLPALTTLDLSNNILRHINSSTFRKIQNLRVLHLRHNRLSRIPDRLDKFWQLQKLDLRSNSISKLTLSDLATIRLIKHVDLSRNLISELPESIEAVKLGAEKLLLTSRIEKLDMASNYIRSIPTEAFSTLRSIVSLRLSRNKLLSLHRNSFHDLPRLESLDLSRNALHSIPSLAFHILPSLKNITLSKNEIHRVEDGIFFGCDSLQHVNISHNNLQTISGGSIFGLNNLEILDLSHNHISSFEPNAWSQCPNLKWLSLHANRLQSLPSASFRSLSNLEELILSGNSIDSLHKTAMTGLDNLHRLDLSSNTLAVCVEDGAVLYNTSMPYLKSLRFTNNQLRVIPSRAFERFPELEVLDLTDNPIATIHPDAFEPLRLKKLVFNSSSFLCDCQISWFGSWLYSSQLDRSKIVAKCAYPTPLRNLNVIAIDTANLTCDDSPRAKVISHPISVRTQVKSEAKFSCTGYGHAPLLLEWRVIEHGKPRILVPDTSTIINVNTTAVINGTMDGHELTASELILHDVALTDRAEYQCVVRNRFGADFSTFVTLTVLQPPTFLHEPDDISLLVGQNAKFMCAATGFPSPKMKWSYNGGEAFPSIDQRRLYAFNDDDHLYIMNVSTSDQGTYTCLASNEADDIQASATLRVFKNEFRTQLEPRIVTQGDTVVLECIVDLIPGVQRMIWRKDGSEIKPHAALRTTVTDHGQILIITNLHSSDSGHYSCELWAGGTQLTNQQTRVSVLDSQLAESQETSNQIRTYKTLASNWKPNLDPSQTFYLMTGITIFMIASFMLICVFACVCLRRILVNRDRPTYV